MVKSETITKFGAALVGGARSPGMGGQILIARGMQRLALYEPKFKAALGKFVRRKVAPKLSKSKDRKSEQHMTIAEVPSMLGSLSAFFALLAAASWIHSATVKIRAEHQSGLNAAVVGGFVHFTADGITYDLHKTLRLQSKWNARAAVLAAFAAVLQLASNA